ncbi:MAG: DUF4954 family protein [Ignavibacterium sp.]|jgi:hypothetical protein|nr:DUF4954 family protein [Ignavibacterium sp.]
MNYRNPTNEEIVLLLKNGCNADNWNKIFVSEKFRAEFVKNVNFYGEIFIGDNVRIADVRHLSNYKIENDTVLNNVASISVDYETAFGNGTRISVLNEGGGRELFIYDKLSAQIAYLMVTCRHDSEFIESLTEILEKYSASKKSNIGKIGEGSSIKNCGVIKNVWMENSVVLEGVTNLSEGTILSSEDDPVKIENNVIAKHFIIQSGSSLTDGVLIDNCFIGQGVRMGKQYSAENCAFFSNSEAYHGEAVSIFAGPYTVTHHKSTLLIAAMFSFYNAGSGTNQSNHMYKLGPLHQGIMERGSKTGSFSYMLWPSRVGAFSVVIGKHYTNFDASEFPFSYINEEDGESVLTPAMNLFTVGTRRDSEKWPTRDRRKDLLKYDIINFELLNPYLIGKIIEGSERMKELLEKANKEQEYVSYKGLKIKRLLLKTCTKYYEIAIKIYIGQEVIKRISDEREFEKIKSLLKYDPELYSEKWVDVAGMFISKKDYDSLIKSISGNNIKDLTTLDKELQKLNEDYISANWAWCAKLIEKRFSTSIEELSKDQVVQIITDWRDNSIKLNNMILKDAEKEFDQTSRIGFGLDGNDEVRENDFANVRGKYDENKFVKELRKESEKILAKSGNMINLLNS